MFYRIIKKLYRNVLWFLVNHFFVGTGYFEIKRKCMIALGYDIGNGTKIVGPIFCTGNLIVGNNCWIGRNFTVNGNGTVIIENCVDIAPNVSFITGGHKIGNISRRAGNGESYSIRICDGCWIGARSTLVGNITVGLGVVVAACSCVVKSIASNNLVGGVPAKVIRELDSLDNVEDLR